MPPLAKFRTFNKPFVFNLQKNPFVGRQPSLQAGGVFWGAVQLNLAPIWLSGLGVLSAGPCATSLYFWPQVRSWGARIGATLS